MENGYPQAFFSSPGMVSVFVIVMALLVLSLIYFAAILLEYRVLRRRHEEFFRAMHGGEVHHERASVVILWVYIILTIFVTLVALWLFLFQPHLL